jgi:phenylacetate-CoA ligase
MIKTFIHKFYHEKISRDNLFKDYKFVNDFQFSSIEKINLFQLDLLKNLLIHADKNSHYYHNLFKTNNIDVNAMNLSEEIKKIPFLTKDIIRLNTNEIKVSNIPDSKITKNATSGTTGSNLIFYRDNNVTIKQALDLRCDNWMNRGFEDKELKIWGASWDVKKNKKIISSIKSWFKSTTVVSGYKLTDSDFGKYVQLIHKYKPYLLTSYPSILNEFAKYVKNHNLCVKIGAIKSAGEKLHAEQRILIEEVFNVKVFDFYGARDIPMIAMQCGNDQGLHVMSENVYLEVVNDIGEPIIEGEGDLVLTDLHNFAFPFIRYKIGDRVRVTKRKCSCGRELPLIDEVVGRTFDIITFNNGNRVGGTFWTFVSKSVIGIVDFQVIQEQDRRIIFNYKHSEINKKVDEITLEKNIREFAGQDTIIVFKSVNSIPINKNGKRQFVISKIKT